MSWIRTVPEDEAEGELAELYARVGNPDGTVDNVLKVHSLHPASLRAHFELYKSALHGRSPLSRAERELVAVAVSRLNGCAYCLEHHRAGLERLWPAERRETAADVAEGGHAGLDDRERALVDYAERLTSAPASMSEADLDALRLVGLDDRALLDLAQVIGYFNYVNRIVTALGVRLGQGEGPPGQWPRP
jgi:uncharacterized peroxidase-related enzyme